LRRGLIAAVPMAPSPPPAFDRWLNGPAGAPLAVALSGGGDSLALLHLAKAWADRAGRRLIALTVDHGLQAASGDWSRFAAERAARLGVPHQVLPWLGAKPERGLPAAARAARQALLAEAARSAGAHVILMGHTADDLLEAETMRAAGASAPSPRAWSPSPAWPEGRGVFVLRPLLDHRRAGLRALLEDIGESWIEDPANDDPRFARTLARRRLTRGVAAAAPPVVEARPRWPGLEAVRMGIGGELTAPRAALVAAEPSEARVVIGALALCAAGTQRPPSTASLDRIAERLRRGECFTASLAGARIEAAGEEVRFCREAGERTRRGLQPAPLPVGESVFDGRFELRAAADDYLIDGLRGRAARLAPEARARLSDVPPAARGALPAVIAPDGQVTCPALYGAGPATTRPLTRQRLCATLGDVRDEAALWRVAETEMGA
jgi:tRNA(Ile)-lysidine synthase